MQFKVWKLIAIHLKAMRSSMTGKVMFIKQQAITLFSVTKFPYYTNHSSLL